MSSIKQGRLLFCLLSCLFLLSCSREHHHNDKYTKIRKTKNDFVGNGMAGWIWQGVASDVDYQTQIWQITLPISIPNWTIPNRFYPPMFPDQAHWDIKTTGDFNGDGTTDILWRHKTTGAWKVWHMYKGLRESQNPLPDFDEAHEWEIVGAADTDRDGDDDVILNNVNTGEVMIWEMQNDVITATHKIGIKAGYRVSRIGDFNGDGDGDLLLRQADGDALVIWEIENNAFVQERRFPDTGEGWNPVCAADVDGDGDDDILMLKMSNNQEKWFVIENYARVAQKVGAPNIGFTLLGCGDYDGDGDADTLWQSKVDGKSRVILQQNYGAKKQMFYMNAFGGKHPANAGYGFEFRANKN